MPYSIKVERCFSQQQTSLLLLKILLISFTGWISIAVLNADHGQPAQRIFAALFLYSIASLVFRWGWVIPCTVVGTVLGLFAGDSFTGCVVESQMSDAVTKIVFGLAGGFVIGWLFDQFESNAFPAT